MEDNHQRLPPGKGACLASEWSNDDIIGLLEENHRLRREVTSLTDMLRHSVDVNDFKHLLQKTLHSVERKQLVTERRSAACIGCSSCHSGNGSMGRQGMSSCGDGFATSHYQGNHLDCVYGYGRAAEDRWMTSQHTAVRNPILSDVLNGHCKGSSSGLLKYHEPIHVPVSASGINVMPSSVGTSGANSPRRPGVPYIVKVQSLAEMPDLTEGQSRTGCDNVSNVVEIPTIGHLQDTQNVVDEKPDLPDTQDLTTVADNDNSIEVTSCSSGLVTPNIGDDNDEEATQAHQDSSVDTILYPTLEKSPTRENQENQLLPDTSQDAHPGPRKRRKTSGQEMVELAPNSGVHIRKKQLSEAKRAGTYTRMIVNLMRALFTGEELATCSVSGRGKNQEYAPRPALDKKKVSAIVDAVQATFGYDVSPSAVKQHMCSELWFSRKRLERQNMKQQS